MKYSGRTTAYEHKFGDWASKPLSPDTASSIQQVTVFEVQWSDCPVEVEAEVKQMWENYDAGNDHWYLAWESEEMSEDYPLIDEYLKSKGVTECLIHWWW